MGKLFDYFTARHDWDRCDYFSAPDDETALTVFDGDPDDPEYDPGPQGAGFRTLESRMVDPYVELGTIMAALVGRPSDVVVGLPRHCDELGTDPEEDTTTLVTVTDQLRDAAADASPGQLAAVAEHWVRTTYMPVLEVELLSEWLEEFAALARYARAQGHRLYGLTSLT